MGTIGWFDEQIQQRRERDGEALSDALFHIAGAVTGERTGDSRRAAQNAVEEILKFYRVPLREVPDNIRDLEERLEYLLRPGGVMRRTVRLEKGWRRDASGAMLALRREDGTVTALIPGRYGGYTYLDRSTGRRVRVTARDEALFEPEATAFYKPFPLRALGAKDLLRYMAEALTGADLAALALAGLAVAAVGLLTPWLNRLLFSRVLPGGSGQALLAAGVFLLCARIGALLLESVRALLLARVDTRLSLRVQAAVMMRILSLPPEFFKTCGSGDLASRAEYVNAFCGMLVSTVLSAALTSLFSLLYLPQIAAYAPELALPALAVIAAAALLSAASALVQVRISRQRMELEAKEAGMSYALISGIQKIKLSGAEKRAFARWGELYAREAALAYDPPALVKLGGVLSTAVSLAGTLALYYLAVRSGVSVPDYYAFNAAYGMASGAFFSLSAVALTAAQLRPILEMAKPILETVPEVSEGKQVLTRLSGGIELNNVSFRYKEGTPNVIDDLSLKIRPGQYVAVVGATGCGKSTLMRLLLGFETPQKGAVYYDGKDLSAIDLKSLRRRIGVVMQDGKLFSGDIYSNIVISAPWLTLDGAWAAAELAGVAEDIRRMPMGMHTLISEGSGGISGGQRQRLMIARAVAPRPRILMFDEATSALDNLTQKQVAESLEGLKCTRIVIAHRLSTIRQCDRIILLENGKIAEDGTYDELLALGGRFAALVERQQLGDERERR